MCAINFTKDSAIEMNFFSLPLELLFYDVSKATPYIIKQGTTLQKGPLLYPGKLFRRGGTKKHLCPPKRKQTKNKNCLIRPVLVGL